MKADRLIKDKEPFLILQYFVTLRFVTDTATKAYCIVFMEKKQRKEQVISRDDYEYLIGLQGVRLSLQNEHGKIYEFGNFKRGADV